MAEMRTSSRGLRHVQDAVRAGKQLRPPGATRHARRQGGTVNENEENEENEEDNEEDRRATTRRTGALRTARAGQSGSLVRIARRDPLSPSFT
jgi:hypothetical protein